MPDSQFNLKFTFKLLQLELQVEAANSPAVTEHLISSSESSGAYYYYFYQYCYSGCGTTSSTITNSLLLVTQ